MRHLNHSSEPVARVLSLLKDARPSGSGWTARCPAHDDRTPSLSITQGHDGRALLHCHAGCAFNAIVAALGIEERELFPPTEAAASPRRRPPTPPREFDSAAAAADAYRATLGTEAAKWVYRDAQGEPIGLVMRWDREDGSKAIRPAWRFGERWRLAYPEARPLYALDRLMTAPGDRVFVVEGEKCAEVVSTLGLTATTSPGGSNSAAKGDWSPLAGRQVVVLPDADEPGRKYAAGVLEHLARLDPPARACILALPGLGDGEDAVEFVGRVHGGDLTAAREAIEELASVALAGLRSSAKRITLGELLADPRLRRKPETIVSGWEPFDRAQPFEAIERGAKIVLAAPPGCYKTATMLRLARGFAEQGHRVAWLAAEMQPRALVRRMLCQSAGLGQAALLSESMPADHARLLADAGKRLAAIEQRIEFTTAPIGFDEIDRAAEAADVVFVDYLQLLQHPEPSARGHERIEDAMARIAAAAQRTGAAFVLAAAQGRDGGGEVRELHNAVRGSSAVEFTVDALYSATAPSDRERGNPAGITIEFKCLKQREGALLPLEVAVDGRTGLLAKDASQ